MGLILAWLILGSVSLASTAQALSPIPLFTRHPSEKEALSAPQEPETGEPGSMIEREGEAPDQPAEFPSIPGVPDLPRPQRAEEAEEEAGILTPKGTLIIEPSLEYSFWSVEQIEVEGFVPPLTTPSVDVTDIDRDVYTVALTLRYGLIDRLEMETKLPFVWRQDDISARTVGPEPSVKIDQDESGSGFGDVEFGARYQINRPQGWWPTFVGTVRFRAPTGEDQFDIDTDSSGLPEEVPTGSGFWGVQPGVMAMYQTTRVNYFGSFRYTWNIESDVDQVEGDVDPGDVIDLSLDTVFHLFKKISFGIGYQHQIVGKTKRDNRVVKGPDTLQIGILKLGASYQVHRVVGGRLTVGVGLTHDAPDVVVFFDVPISIQVLR